MLELSFNLFKNGSNDAFLNWINAERILKAKYLISPISR